MLWGFAFAAQGRLSVLPTFMVVGARNLLAALFLFLVIPLMDKITGNGRKFISRRGIDFTKTELIGGSLCGVILATASALQQFGIVLGDNVGKAAFISALYVLIVPIIGLVIGRRSPLNAWIGVFVAIGGFYLLCIDTGFTVDGADLIVLLSASVYALHIITIDRFSPKCDGVRMSCIQFSVAFVISSVLSLIFEGAPDFTALFSVLPALLYFGVCSGGIAYTLQIIGQRDSDPAVASIILSLESVFGAIGGAIFLGEKMEIKEYIGCAVVFIAIVIAQLDFPALFKKRLKNPKN